MWQSQEITLLFQKGIHKDKFLIRFQDISLNLRIVYIKFLEKMNF